MLGRYIDAIALDRSLMLREGTLQCTSISFRLDELVNAQRV
jgi:hypothetical protein